MGPVGRDQLELPVADQIHLCVAGVRWKWASEGNTVKDTPARISRWLGTVAGVTPNRARDWLEPYARRLDTGLIHSPTACEAQNRASAKRTRRQVVVSREPSGSNTPLQPAFPRLADRIVPMPTMGVAAAHDGDTVMDNTTALAMPVVSQSSTSAPMDVNMGPDLPDEAEAATAELYQE